MMVAVAVLVLTPPPTPPPLVLAMDDPVTLELLVELSLRGQRRLQPMPRAGAEAGRHSPTAKRRGRAER